LWSYRSLSILRPALDDDQLMARVQRDESDAFHALYERHARCALSAARAVKQDRAEDAVQEGFISVWRNRAHYRSQGSSVQAWIVTIVRRRALDLARSEARVSRTPSPDRASAATVSDSPEDDLIARGDCELVRAALRRLPNLQREVIVLAFFEGMTHHQIAARLALPEGTVKGRMRLGLDRLRSEGGVLR
jgi:RNA polymerase sigma-70 factor (ECF subfamily)